MSFTVQEEIYDRLDDCMGISLMSNSGYIGGVNVLQEGSVT